MNPLVNRKESEKISLRTLVCNPYRDETGKIVINYIEKEAKTKEP